MLHSFWFPETVKAFSAIPQTDPGCAIAYWGLAVSTRPNPLVGPWDAATLKRGLDAVEKGEAIGAKTQRERDWRRPGHAQQELREGELNETFDHKNMEPLLKAIRILEPLDKVHPDHPGITHYLIHSYDFAPIARKGIPAANKYAKVAPAAPHAQHMPSHIYSMVGMWQESDWASAIRLLSSAALRDTRNAEIQNYLGYAHRNSGDLPAAFKHYARALQLNPRHRGAHEYLGEAYLMIGNVHKAEEHLSALKSICLLPCREYGQLEKKLAEYRSR